MNLSFDPSAEFRVSRRLARTDDRITIGSFRPSDFSRKPDVLRSPRRRPAVGRWEKICERSEFMARLENRYRSNWPDIADCITARGRARPANGHGDKGTFHTRSHATRWLIIYFVDLTESGESVEWNDRAECAQPTRRESMQLYFHRWFLSHVTRTLPRETNLL